MPQRWLDIRSMRGALRLLRDGTGDWAPTIQAAIHQILDGGSEGTLYLPPGHYRIDGPIFIGPVVGLEYRPVSLTIVGEAEDDTARVHGSVIVPSYGNLPAIIVQAAQSVTLRKLGIFGRNLWSEEDQRGPDGVQLSEELLGIDPYVVPVRPGGPLCRDQPGSPYAGLCIDPFHPEVPPEERYPGLEDRYLPGPASRDVHVEDCHIQGFVVGVCVAPSGRELPREASGELTLRMSKTFVANMKSCLSVSGPRKIFLESIGLSTARHAIDCVGYTGGQRRPGHCPSIHGANIGFVKHIFRTGNTGASATIAGMYIESALGLGQLGTPPRSPGEPLDHYTLTGCAFTISTPQENLGFEVRPDPRDPMGMKTIQVKVWRPVPALSAHLINFAHTRLLGCSFKPNRGDRRTATEAPVHLVNHGTLSLEGCSIGGGKARQVSEMPEDSPTNPELGASFWISGAMERVSMLNCDITDVRIDRDTGVRTVEPTVMSERQVVPSFLKQPYMTAQAWPGGLYMLDDELEVQQEAVLDDMGAVSPTKSLGSPLRWVAGEYPLIPLAKPDGTVHSLRELNLKADGTGSFVCEKGKLVEGDVLVVGRPWPNALVEPRGEAGRGQLLLGRAVKVTPGDGTGTEDAVLLEFVPAALLQDADKYKDESVPLIIAYFPRIHPTTVGNIVQGELFVNNVQVRPVDDLTQPLVPLRQAWAKGHRVQGDGIPIGTFVTSTSLVPNRIHLSQKLESPAGPVTTRIFDADIQGIDAKKR